MLLKALIFDVDGTLAETEELHRQAFNESFAAFGLGWSWDPNLYRQLLQVTGGKERMRHFIETAQPPGAERALGHFAELHAEKTRRYGELARGGMLKPRPGVLRLIKEARAAGIKLAIATTTDPANVEALLQASFAPEAVSWFSVVGAGDVVPEKKPAPDVYLYVLQRLGCAPSEAIAFEDSENGILAARGAGLTVIATPSFYTDADDFSQAQMVLSDLGEEGRPCRQLVGKKLSGGTVTLMDLRDLAGRSEPADTGTK
ncbi:HAD family hydrolase [Methylovirgula sp. HY1]|uniref:HAD family hydrolase n=1 Tax=Methylovirgula sp. HY1 TaxID=2822761 RepID=UPI001C5BF970|nr:HAD family hydrolase [Methylovirgula sp. HY1]QXX75056.1 Phosphorylated carbohydrates phosphatase [Methylovirgula sp. HY1]